MATPRLGLVVEDKPTELSYSKLTGAVYIINLLIKVKVAKGMQLASYY